MQVMDPNIQKAEEYISQANRLRGGGFFSFMSRSDKHEQKLSLLEKAANCYKMGKAWSDAGKIYQQAAELCKQNNSQHEAAVHYVSAATALKKEDPLKAIECLTKAIEIYTDAGRFTIAARHHMDIAEMYEKLGNLEQAMRHYEKAADFYHGEDSRSSAMKCKLNVAQLAVQLRQYETAATLFDEVGRAYINEKLLKYSAKDPLFKSVLCKLLIDIVGGQKLLKSYQESYPMFEDSRECKLVQKLCTALEGQDVEAFTLAVKEYDSISRLETTTTSMLLQLKKTISEDEDEDIT